MAQFMEYPLFIRWLAKKYLRQHYGREARARWNRTRELYRAFVEEAPDVGGRENNMSSNLYMALAVFAFYEAADRSVTREELEAMMENSVPRTIPVVSALADLNKLRNQEKLRVRYEKYKELTDRKLDAGEWGNNWRVAMNPRGREKGVAFDLVGCPLADFAKKHGYGDIMPLLCRFDHVTASILHARLIREHTVAEGSGSCDFWYVGDRETDPR